MSPSNTAARHFVHAIGKKWSAWLSGDQTREIHWSNIFSPCLVAYRHFFRGNGGWHSVSCVDNDVLVLQLQPENNSQSQSLEFLIMLNWGFAPEFWQMSLYRQMPFPALLILLWFVLFLFLSFIMNIWFGFLQIKSKNKHQNKKQRSNKRKTCCDQF